MTTLKENIRKGLVRKALRKNGFTVSDCLVSGKIYCCREYQIHPYSETRDDGRDILFTFEMDNDLSAKEMVDFISAQQRNVETEDEMVRNHCRDLVNKDFFREAPEEMKMKLLHTVIDCRSGLQLGFFKAIEELCK